MGDFDQQDLYSAVQLVDRTGLGGTEIIYDGKRLKFQPGVPTLIVPRFVAEWMFKVMKHYVWTEDGVYTNRFGIKDISDELLGQLGPDAGNTSPIVIDGNRIEGWDTSDTGRQPGDTKVVQLKAPNLRERQGVSTPSLTFGDRKE